MVIGGGFAGLYAARELRKAGDRGRHHAGRPAEPPPVPAVALPGRDRRAVARRDRAAAAVDPAEAEEHDGAAGRGGADRSRGARGRAVGRRPDPLRHADRRDGRAAQLLRPRRVGAVSRPGSRRSTTRPRSGGGSSSRSRRPSARPTRTCARGVDDVRRSSAAGRPASSSRARSARSRTTRSARDFRLDPPAGRPDPAHRGAGPDPADLSARGRPPPRTRQLEKLGVTVRTGTKVVHIDERRRAGRDGQTARRRSRPAPCSGRRACSRRRSGGRSPPRPAPRPTASRPDPGRGRTSRSPAIPRSSCSATRPCSRGSREARPGRRPGRDPARQVRRRGDPPPAVAGEAVQPFRYQNRGDVAVIGRLSGVTNIPWLGPFGPPERLHRLDAVARHPHRCT